MSSSPPTAVRPCLVWTVRIVALVAVAVVVWACISSWGGVWHGHPLYAVLLGVTLVVGVVVVARSLRPRATRRGWRLVLRVALIALAIGWIALLAWLRPFSAQEPALTAMQSDAAVTVTETATRIVFSPSGTASTTAVFFEPGAKVEARAYAATLRPLAEAGLTVVIAKQPLAIAFLSLGEFDAVRDDYPDITKWAVGGHSLGGIVAAIQADEADGDAAAPVVGLFFYASYPATDISSTLTASVLSVSAANDGLSTPADIDATKSLLPTDTTYVVIAGAVHAYFADYGAQPGDGEPSVDHDVARDEISAATLDFVRDLSGD